MVVFSIKIHLLNPVLYAAFLGPRGLDSESLSHVGVCSPILGVNEENMSGIGDSTLSWCRTVRVVLA